MKKNSWQYLILVTLLLVLAAFLGSCTDGTNENVVVGENEFWLNSLPDLEPFEQFSDISSRYYENYTDKLIPADDYGRLYPYPGNVIRSNWFTEVRYGLCDAKGRIVMDAVASLAYINSFADGTELLQISYAPKNATQEEMDNYNMMDKVTIAAVDGSWAVADISGYVQYANKDVFVVAGNDYDESYSYATCYVFNTADGSLRTELKTSFVTSCNNDMMIINVPNSTGEAISLLVDYDGKTIRELGLAGAMLSGDKIIVKDGNGLYGITDLEGNYLVSAQYQNIRPLIDTEDNHYFCADTVEGGVVVISGTGKTVWKSPNSATITGVIETGEYADLCWVNEYSNGVGYMLDLATGQSGPKLDAFPFYLGNGWYKADYGNKLEIYHWGDDSPWVEMDNKNYYSADLLPNTETIVAMPYYVTDDNGNYKGENTLLYDLESKQEIAHVPGVYSSYIDVGEGYAFWDSASEVYNIYDAGGNLVRKTGFKSINKLDDNHYAVYNDYYGGIVNQEGDWLIRIYINNLD